MYCSSNDTIFKGSIAIVAPIQLNLLKLDMLYNNTDERLRTPPSL